MFSCIICICTAMVIGFASRGQAVGEDAGDVYITVHSNTVSEMDHAVEVVLLTSSTNASVLQKEGAVEILDTTDALFGSSFLGHIKHYFNLRQGLKAYNLTATIIDDDRPECSKCFTLRLSAEPDILGRRDLFSCNNDNTSTFFCYYTLCIMDYCPGQRVMYSCTYMYLHCIYIPTYVGMHCSAYACM